MSEVIDSTVTTPARLGLLSDAHGNPAGLSACLAALSARDCSQLYFLGDAVGYLPFALEVLDVLEERNVCCQMGNHEAMLCGRLPLSAEADAVYGLARLRSTLPVKMLEAIAEWPTRREVSTGGRRIVMLHGGPRSELTEYVYPDSDLSHFEALEADVVAVGHSHHPFVRRQGSTLVIGTGSCGLPRDIGNSASCAVYDVKSDHAEIVRATIDVQALLERACQTTEVHPSVVRCLLRGTEGETG